jgi:hypothetical protein
MRACVGAGLTLCAAGVAAQSQDLQKGLNEFFRAVQGRQGGGGAPSSAPPTASAVDTPENLEVVVRDAKARSRAGGMGPDAYCQGAANPLRPSRIQGSGWMELVAKCTAALEQDATNKEQAGAAQERRRAEIEQAQKTQARRESDDYEARRQALLAGLKAGTIAPKNCAQWMVGRGLDRLELQANEISRVAYRAPQGVGYFDAVIQQIQGESLLVRVRDHLAVVAIDKNSRLFREGELTEQGRIGVVGQQTGKRTLNRPDGSAVTLALVTPSCVVGAPDHLLDLALDGAK